MAHDDNLSNPGHQPVSGFDGIGLQATDDDPVSVELDLADAEALEYSPSDAVSLDADIDSSLADVGPSRSLASDAWKRFRRNKLAMFGLFLVLFLVVVGLVGPFVVAAPGVLLALADSPAKAAWTVLIYIGVGQVESNLFSPFMLRQMAKLPMALTLFAVLAFGLLLGPLGVLLATPLAVVAFVLVRTLYIDGVLNGAGGFRRNRQANPVV